MHDEESVKQEAIAAAETWLHLIDKADFSESWKQAAAMFKGAIKEEQWLESLNRVQGMFGRALSRSVKSSQYATELPGAPDGEYVVIEFETSFEHKQNGIETVTPMKDDDGEWRVSGYYIR